MKYHVKLNDPLVSSSRNMKMGASRADGSGLWVDERCFMRDGVPFIPVMGEIHYSRYPHGQWRQALQKMKASGINVAATYVFWNHHEEIQGEYDWSGDRNLRLFLQTAAECGLYVWLRIGPWCHGEVRYGGFPDWVQALPGARTNDETYLRHAERLYGQIAAQAKGLLYDDGGPIIGIQIENEYWLTGEGRGKEHMRTLKALALKQGLFAPFYTATGWSGNTVPVDEIMPAFGHYPDAPWAQHTNELEPDIQYFFHPCVGDFTIGADLIKRDQSDTGSDAHCWPYITCEIGGGNQITWHRRPILNAPDITAVSFCLLGSGSVLPGYYMYHGGTNPDGKLSTLQESKATGYPNDLPIRSYDFQAPLGEYGQSRPWLNSLKRLHQFIEANTETLALSTACIPGGIPQNPEDTTHLRWSVRHHGEAGFIFVNNYQRHRQMPVHEDVLFDVDIGGQSLELPLKPLTVPSGAYFALPFNMDLGGAMLRHATCQPITSHTDQNGRTWFFHAPEGILPELAFYDEGIAAVDCANGTCRRQDDLWLIEGVTPGRHCWVDITCTDGALLSVCILDEESSLQLWRFEAAGEDVILFTSADAWMDGDTLCFSQIDNPEFKVWVYSGIGVDGDWVISRQSRYTHMASRAGEAPKVTAEAKPMSMTDKKGKWAIKINAQWPHYVDEIFLKIDYEGDIGNLFMDGRHIEDNFYDGRPWEVGLKRFMEGQQEIELELKIKALPESADIYFEQGFRPQGDLLKLNGISARTVYMKSLVP